MGAHPIFESDFDCLTDIQYCAKWPCVNAPATRPSASALKGTLQLGNRRSSKSWRMRRTTRIGRSRPSPFRSGHKSMANRYIFARNCFESGLMTDTEWAIYQEWSSYLLNSLGELRLDGFIYLRADPKICSSRMAKRGRPEEQGVTIDYLNQLHEKHEAWLHRREFANENIMSDIPILEIDCNLEFHDDEAMKKRMLEQVREFVKKLQAAKRAEIEKEIEKLDDSGISRSTTPTSSRGESVNPIPFADIKASNKENVQQSEHKQLCA